MMDLEILKIASDNNNKSIHNCTHRSKLKNHLCGDEIQIKMIIESDKILEFGYEGKSCIYCQAAANLLSKISINKKKWKLMNKIFKSKNKSRKECILLPFKAAKKIVSD